MASGIPLVLGLRTRMQDPSFHAVFGAPFVGDCPCTLSALNHWVLQWLFMKPVASEIRQVEDRVMQGLMGVTPPPTNTEHGEGPNNNVRGREFGGVSPYCSMTQLPWIS